ncbi:MAG TPA: S8/S53 family peptidase [Alphaproteobacteria bacterium]|nr:S8/S53 family peptidase [Alphaproteobacteria bacterium]
MNTFKFSLLLLSFSSLVHAGKDFEKTPREIYDMSDGFPYTGKGAKVAILDTEYNFYNPILKGKIAKVYDAVEDRMYTAEDYPASQYLSHGTLVAQTIAEIAPDCEIYPIMIRTPAYHLTPEQNDNFERAFKYVSEISPHVVNMSYEFGGVNMESLTPHFYKMAENQTVFMKSADNHGTTIKPAYAEDEKFKPYICQVGALSTSGCPLVKNYRAPEGHELFRPGSSNFPASDFEGNFFWARGHYNLLKQPSSYEKSFHQTSAATPLMAGAYALLVEAMPSVDGETRLKYQMDASRLATYENRFSYYQKRHDEESSKGFAKKDMEEHPHLDINKPLLEYLPQEIEEPGSLRKRLESL